MRHHNLILSIVLAPFLAWLSLISGGSLGAQPQTDRAQQVLAQARAALGGEAKLKAIQSLSAAGKYRRLAQGQDISGEAEVEMLLPDKYLKNDTMSIMGAEITRIEAISGDKAWMDSRSGGGGMVVVRNAPANATPQQAEATLRMTRAEFARLLLSFLLTTPTSLPVEFSYVGEAEAPDGRADVIEAKGADNFAARLFFDQKTHLPLMLSFRGTPPRMNMHSASHGSMPSPEEMEKMRKEAQEKAEKEAQSAPKPQEAEIQWRFSDYRQVGGISFPHRITKAADGQVNEEWEMTKFKLNPPLKPGNFEKK